MLKEPLAKYVVFLRMNVGVIKDEQQAVGLLVKIFGCPEVDALEAVKCYQKR